MVTYLSVLAIEPPLAYASGPRGRAHGPINTCFAGRAGNLPPPVRHGTVFEGTWTWRHPDGTPGRRSSTFPCELVRRWPFLVCAASAAAQGRALTHGEPRTNFSIGESKALASARLFVSPTHALGYDDAPC